jgi:NADPH2:quinone reductase
VPDGVDLDFVAGGLLRAVTAHMLFHCVYRIQPGDVVFIHAIAGGLGSILGQWGKHLGAQVIGTASTAEKAAYAYGLGADHVIVGRDADIVADMNKLTQGMGAHYTIDGIGGDMVQNSLQCTRHFGMVASIGQVAGNVAPLAMAELGCRGFSRPSVMAYTANQELYHAAMQETLHMMHTSLKSPAQNIYSMQDAAKAHVDLETGRTKGLLILKP